MTSLFNANGATTATMIHPGQTLCLHVEPRQRRHPRAPTHDCAPTSAAVPAANGPSVSIDYFPAQGPCSYGDSYGAARAAVGPMRASTSSPRPASGCTRPRTARSPRSTSTAPGSLSGNGWRLTTANGTYFFYAHLSTFAGGLSVGSPVKAGQILGQVGMTGDAPIPHLHFEVHPGGGASVNPTPVVKAVDGCKTSAVPPQPDGSVPATTVPATTVPPPTGPAPTLPPVTVPAPTTTTTVYVPVAHRRDTTYLDGTARPRR